MLTDNICHSSNIRSNPSRKASYGPKMVRIKERYLLVNVLYPEASQDTSKFDLPDILVYNQPTIDTFNGRTLTRAIKNEIISLFGDYGSGAVERTLRGLS